jgi:hypothetical protein
MRLSRKSLQMLEQCIGDRLRQTMHRRCAEPRDKIYALLSLINEFARERYRPDDTKPVHELCTTVSADLIVKSSDAWASVEGAGLGTWFMGWKVGKQPLPLWAVDSSQNRKSYFARSCINGYTFAHSSVIPELYVKGNILRLKATSLGTVTAVIELHELGTSQRNCYGDGWWTEIRSSQSEVTKYEAAYDEPMIDPVWVWWRSHSEISLWEMTHPNTWPKFQFAPTQVRAEQRFLQECDYFH